MSTRRGNDREYRHRYVCKVTADNGTHYFINDPKLPRILKELRERTGYEYKIPHGNKVRTLILEQGVCRIEHNGYQYDITIERW